jgi:hypothetical protein
MVFDPAAAPRNREDFLQWYDRQTEWAEGHSYDDPEVTTPALASWFAEMLQLFPPMNGPLASNDYDDPKVTGLLDWTVCHLRCVRLVAGRDSI